MNDNLDKDLFDSHLELAKFWDARHSARMQIEWKYTLGLWALIGAAIAFMADKPISTCLSLGFCFVILILHYLWLRGIWVGNKNDRALAHYHYFKAEKLLENGKEEPNYPERISMAKWFKKCRKNLRTLFQWREYYWAIGCFSNWSVRFQLYVTTFMLVVFFTFAGSATNKFPIVRIVPL